MPAALMSTWRMPPATMPATAARPARRPPVRELPRTNAMSIPGSTMTPRDEREIEPHGAGLIQVLIVDAIRDIACHV